MIFFPNKAGIGSILTRTYLLIWAPALLIMYAIHSSIEVHITQMRLSALNSSGHSAEIADLTEKLPLVHAIVRPIRQLIGNYQTSPYMIEFLLDLQFVLISFWLGTLLFSAVTLWVLVQRLYIPLNKMTTAIAKLSSGNYNQPIVIEGPTSLFEIGQRLEKLRNRLDQSERTQTQFLRHISHEIKTPLTTIKEGSKLLSDQILGPITDEQREITDILNKSTMELQGSIENLLNYNSSSSVEKIKQRETIDLVLLIETAIEKQTLACKSKNLVLDLHIEPTRSFVDTSQMTTVFENLLSNAIKYSPVEGSIKLELVRRGKRIEFTIQDQGPGVPKDQRDAIFSAFYVGDQFNQGPLKGTGLGLSIVQQYVELHEGRVEVIDLPNSTLSGACFRVTFKD